MVIPPHITAFVTAKAFSFLFGDLANFSPAIFASCNFLRNLGGRSYITADVVPAAEGLDGVLR